MSECSLTYDDAVPPATGRARPLTPDARRAHIISAVTPLLIEHGTAVTSRQLAEAAGVAEGTVFRAFGDKESLITAVIDAHRDPAAMRVAIAEIEGEPDLDGAIERILDLLVGRLTTLVRLSIALHRHGPPKGDGEHAAHRAEFEQRSRELAEQLTVVLEPFADRLAVAPAIAAGFLRMVATAAALPHLHPGMEFTVSDLSTLVREGVVLR